MVTTTSAAAAQAAGLSATSPRCSCAHASARSRVRFHTVTGNPARTRFAAMREPMIPSPMKPTRSANAATSRSLDSQSLPLAQLARGLGGELLAVEEVAPPFAVAAPVDAGRGVAPSLGEQGVRHARAGLDLADHPVAAVVAALAAGPAPQGVLGDPERELELEGLHRGVQRVRHGHVDARGAVGIRAGALPAADRLVVGELVR